MRSTIPGLRAGALVLVMAATGCGYNSIQGADEDVKAAWAEVQNQFQRRLDLVPNLVNTVKGSASFEQETLQAVVEARSKAAGIKLDSSVLDDPQAFQRFQQAQGQLSGALSRLLVVVERYPDLKANQGFLKLQDELSGTENRIAVERRRYNEVVRAYNITVKRFPGRVWAAMFGFEKRDVYFEVAEEEKAVPKVEF